MKEVFQCLLFSAGMQMKTEGVIYPRPQNSANPKAMQCTPSRALINVTLSAVVIIVVAACFVFWSSAPKRDRCHFCCLHEWSKNKFSRVY